MLDLTVGIMSVAGNWNMPAVEIATHERDISASRLKGVRVYVRNSRMLDFNCNGELCRATDAGGCTPLTHGGQMEVSKLHHKASNVEPYIWYDLTLAE